MKSEDIASITFYSFDAVGPRSYGFTVVLKDGNVVEIEDSGWKKLREFIAKNKLDPRHVLEKAISDTSPDVSVRVYP